MENDSELINEIEGGDDAYKEIVKLISRCSIVQRQHILRTLYLGNLIYLLEKHNYDYELVQLVRDEIISDYEEIEKAIANKGIIK